jgi:glucose/mannose transport system permease protein
MAPSGQATPQGIPPRRVTASRTALYVLLAISALFFIAPLYTMLVTSLKPMSEIRGGSILALPASITFEPWVKAWSGACTGRNCNGVSVGFVNSFRIVIPTVILTVLLGAINGYALSFWRFRFANLIYTILLLGAVIPLQVFIFPVVRLTTAVGLFGTLPGIVIIHTCFGLPFITLLYRNFYASVPQELFNAARIDGGRFWNILFFVMAPISVPITIVAVILQFTGTWNEFILGLVFAGRENMPITVLLNNIVGSERGTVEYNVNMAATVIAAVVPLAVYFVSGRWFVRGIAEGALKG